MLLKLALASLSYRSPTIQRSFSSLSHQLRPIKNISYSSSKIAHPVVRSYYSVEPRKARVVGWWLMGMASMCFGAVVLGGITRLTESGLSMTSWHPITEVPPTTAAGWFEEFERYKSFPEYAHVVANKGEMTLSQFKFIYYMEYAHRMWGRAIGVAFLLPAAYFQYAGYFSPSMSKRVLFMGGLIGFQGLLGWYMVKSGLEDKRGSGDIPRVSQYRLAAHLGSAFVLYSLFFWNGLSHLTQSLNLLEFPGLTKIRGSIHGVKALVFLTAMSGALVAGLDAGMTYNTWPKMADRWIPSDLYAMPGKWKNNLENPTTVQFNHRHLAEFTGACIFYMWWRINRRSMSSFMHPRVRLLSHIAVAAVCGQITLGVSTLLCHVPVWLAACHQSGSLILLSVIMALSHAVRRLPK